MSNKAEIGRIILWATGAGSHARISHDEARKLAMECLRLADENKLLRAIVDEVHSWAVCGAIATPADMAQNLPHIVEITGPQS